MRPNSALLAAEMLERLKPKKDFQEQRLTADEAKKILDVYEKLFSPVPCSKCGYVASQEGS